MGLVRVLLLCVVSLSATDNVTGGSETPCKECELKIPLEMALKLNTITDENQLFREFLEKPKTDNVEAPIVKTLRRPVAISPDSVSDRFGGDLGSLERKALIKAKPAGCIPELQSVSLRRSEDPWIVYWPSCTRVEQCGGCCSYHLLSCQPVETEQLNFQVVVFEYVGNKLVYKDKTIVSVDKHTKCKCDCIIKEMDCNELQEYRKGECRCACKDRDAEVACKNSNRSVHWNSLNCSCECLNIIECSTGSVFNRFTCSCEPVPDDTPNDDKDLSTSLPHREHPLLYSYNINE